MHNLLLNISILPNRWQKQYYIINTTSVILSIKQYLSLLNEGLPNKKNYKQNSFFLNLIIIQGKAKKCMHLQAWKRPKVKDLQYLSLITIFHAEDEISTALQLFYRR